MDTTQLQNAVTNAQDNLDFLTIHRTNVAGQKDEYNVNWKKQDDLLGEQVASATTLLATAQAAVTAAQQA